MSDDPHNTLPRGWSQSTIGEITVPVDKINSQDDPDREVDYIDISSIDNVRNVVTGAKRFTLRDAPSRARQIVRAGDILFATVRPYLRNIARVPDQYDAQIASTGFSVLRPAPGVEPEFLFYKAISVDFVNALSAEQYGVSYPAVTDEQVRAQPFWLPPQNEQRHIIEKVEELFSELDKGTESLRTARAQLGIYRHSLLKSAFAGRLTAAWRTENSQETSITKDAYFAELARMRRDSRKANPALLSSSDLAGLPSLPEGWFWERLGWMTSGVEYGTSAKSSDAGRVPVLRMGNIQNAKLDWSELAYTSDPEEIRKYALAAGDVLFNRTNSPELVGKTAIYRGERPAVFAGYLIRINQNPSFVDSQYLNLFLNSPIARHHGNRVKTDEVNQSNINGEKLANYPFPYCSPAEQKEITKQLEEQLSIVDQLEEDIDLQIKKSSVLRQSILKKALAGKLVKQDSADEPASRLLERIGTQKTQSEHGKKKNGRRQAA